jgi:putative ABC transport system permease protein
MISDRLYRNVKLGVKSLLLHKLRSMLTMLGVVFGVGSVVAMLSVGEGASRQAQDQIARLGSNNIVIESAKIDDKASTQRSGGYVYMNIYGLLYEDEMRIRESYPDVTHVVPAKLFNKEARLGDKSADVRVVGTTPQWFELVQRDLIAGRTITWTDMDQGKGVVVLAEHAARKLLVNQHTIGQHIRIGGDYYKVIGIVKSDDQEHGDVQTPDRPFDAYIPINVVRHRLGDIDVSFSAGNFRREMVELHQIILRVGAVERVEPVAKAVNAMLERFHRQRDYKMTVPLSLLRQAREAQRIFNIVLGSIAGISLLVGGIGIMNIMLASVTERTREIGIRRAIGAQRAQIIGQFLIETVVLSTVGGIMGVGLGLAIPQAITYFANMPTVVTTWSVLLSLGISAAVGILFGLYPAWRAAQLDPIIALRHV